jgi:2-amino-4-hydroxy-6-hydroxymethyldihydropteridine diphosphokinase
MSCNSSEAGRNHAAQRAGYSRYTKVMVTPHSILNDAYLILGSNIEPEFNLRAAVELLTTSGTIRRVSRVWQSPPADGSNQPDYLNAAVLLQTLLHPAELRRQVIAEIETRLGRRRNPADPYAPRTIDIDIALFNHEVLDCDGRRIPDPDILTRPFVAVPLAELNADYVHPENGRTLAEIAAAFDSPAITARDQIRLLSPGRARE